MKVKSLSRAQFLATPWTAAYQAPLSMGFSRQEYWSGLPLPSLMTNLDNILKSRDITLPTKVHLVKDMVFPVVMHRCESWTIKKAEHWRIGWFWTVVLEKILESSLDCKEIKLVNSKGNQSWIFIGRTDAEAETPIFWPPDTKNWLNGKDPDAGKDWSQEENGMTEDEMVGWHHQLNGREFEQALGVGDRQGSLAAAIHGVAKSQTWLSNWIELIII